MNNYKPTFGIKFRHKRSKNVKSEKGDPGIGFKLTADNNYDMINKRLANIGQAKQLKDAINKEYFDNEMNRFSSSFQQEFLKKNEDIDMNNKAIKIYLGHTIMKTQYLKSIYISMDYYWILNLTVLMQKIRKL